MRNVIFHSKPRTFPLFAMVLLMSACSYKGQPFSLSLISGIGSLHASASGPPRARVILPEGATHSDFAEELERDLGGEYSALRKVWIADETDVSADEFRAVLGYRRNDGCYLDEVWIGTSDDGLYQVLRLGESNLTHCRYLR